MIPKEPGPTFNRISLLPEVGEFTPLGRGYPGHTFLRNSGFYLMARDPPVVQIELSGLPFEVWETGVSIKSNPPKALNNPTLASGTGWGVLQGYD